MLALIAVVGGVLLLAAAAFVLSYAGIHLVALSAGVSPRLARIYPLIFDAMLVVAGAAILALRGAGFFSRIYAWLSMLVLLAAAAGADTLHATGTRLPHKPAAATAAIIPWALVLIGFGLLLCLLRHARLRKAAAATQHKAVVPASGHVELRPGLNDLLGPRSAAAAPARPQVPAAAGVPAQGAPDEPRSRVPAEPAQPPAAPSIPAQAGPPADPGAEEPADADDLAIDTEPDHDDPASDEGAEDDRATDPTSWSVRARENHLADDPASAFSAAPTMVADHPEAAEETDEGEDGSQPGVDAAARVGAVAEAVAEAHAGAETGTDAKTGAEADTEADFGDEDGPEDDTTGEDPAPAGGSPFDRVRSSPVPPEA
ncbi:MAG TPA: DUF2637 domain-containing protein [Streptosporangiaceae bacterium]|nr:DUF2637 domain-containing protein [Streptosporangiaceae bacterium]